MGGLAALLAGAGGPPMPKPYPFEAFVLIAVPNELSGITRKFGDEQNLSAAGQRDFERRLEKKACRTMPEFTGARLLRETGKPALVIHSRDDDDVPYADAEVIATACPDAELLTCDGIGHRVILYTPDIVRAATRYFEQKANTLNRA